MTNWLVTSNPHKINEFNSFGADFTAIKGPDVPEIMSDSVLVALYKAFTLSNMDFAADLFKNGDSLTVEDTILAISENDAFKEIVDIRWRFPESDSAAVWKTILATVKNDVIYLYKGETFGRLDSTRKIKDEQVFGFDDIFIPKGTDKTLFELKKENKKNEYSARKKAVEAFLGNKPFFSIEMKYIAEWNGQYQNEENSNHKTNLNLR